MVNPSNGNRDNKQCQSTAKYALSLQVCPGSAGEESRCFLNNMKAFSLLPMCFHCFHDAKYHGDLTFVLEMAYFSCNSTQVTVGTYSCLQGNKQTENLHL